jgi:hypothetical protein
MENCSFYTGPRNLPRGCAAFMDIFLDAEVASDVLHRSGGFSANCVASQSRDSSPPCEKLKSNRPHLDCTHCILADFQIAAQCGEVPAAEC